MTRWPAALLTAWLCASPAQAHDPATGLPNWITANHRYCCGPEDCAPLDVGEYEIRDDGVWLPQSQELITFDRIQRSEDFRPWRCQYLHGTLAGKTRCLFLPGNS